MNRYAATHEGILTPFQTQLDKGGRKLTRVGVSMTAIQLEAPGQISSK